MNISTSVIFTPSGEIYKIQHVPQISAVHRKVSNYRFTRPKVTSFLSMPAWLGKLFRTILLALPRARPAQTLKQAQTSLDSKMNGYISKCWQSLIITWAWNMYREFVLTNWLITIWIIWIALLKLLHLNYPFFKNKTAL